MTGEDFISLAVRLSASANEAEARSSVSRAYYGAFHVAFAFLTGIGIRLPKTAAAHDKLFQCLANSGDFDLLAAATLLAKLRAERNSADYDLETVDFRKTDHARMIVRSAAKIVAGINACDLSTVRAKIRTYAQQVQRLPVGDP